MADAKHHKMAASIRASSASDQFDCAGFGPADCANAASALEKPLPLATMIRLTFVVGGGKKVRQKYADGLPTILCEALRNVGYTEDQGAALSMDCAGTFKYQHDTGKDLKYVHAFPRVDPSAAGPASDAADAAALKPGELMVFSELSTFKRMVAAKTPSFSQRRRALVELKRSQAQRAH